MERINENYRQGAYFRNDIYRKFERQFKILLSANYDMKMYVDYGDVAFVNKINDFIKSAEHSMQFFVGFAGTGKTTYLKKTFKYQTFAPIIKNQMLVMPIGWNGLHLADEGYEQEIDSHIKDYISNAIAKIYKPISNFMLDECDAIGKFIETTSPSIYCELDNDEIFKTDQELSCVQRRLIKTQKTIQ